MNDRRAEDPRIEQLVTDLSAMKTAHAAMQTQLTENTKVTKQVRDILASFKVIGACAKWGTIIGAAGTSVYHGIKALFHF